jgi:anti-sigma factor (TIGR02949 family)
MKNDCQEIRDSLSGFVDDEIPSETARKIAAHLSDCPACNGVEQTQRGIKGLLRNRLPMQAAPHHLRARVMNALRTQPASWSFRSLLQRLFEFQPVPAFASVALLLALTAGISTWMGKTTARQPAKREALALVTNGQIEGVFTCVDCELLDISKTPYTHDQNHRLAVKCDDGIFWNILQTTKGSEMSSLGGLMRRRVRIKGHLFPVQHLVDVTDYSVI